MKAAGVDIKTFEALRNAMEHCQMERNATKDDVASIRVGYSTHVAVKDAP